MGGRFGPDYLVDFSGICTYEEGSVTFRKKFPPFFPLAFKDTACSISAAIQKARALTHLYKESPAVFLET